MAVPLQKQPGMDNKKLSIIAFSGDSDKLTAAFTLGTGAAALGYEVI